MPRLTILFLVFLSLSSNEARTQALPREAPPGGWPTLSPDEVNAFRTRLSQCWHPPAGVTSGTKIRVTLRVLMKSDGTVAGDPTVIEGASSSLGLAVAESAKQALLTCQPFAMLRPEHYEQWKDLMLMFDPQELLKGK
jgi:hypothetical protein